MKRAIRVATAALTGVLLLAVPAFAAESAKVGITSSYICWELTGTKPPNGLARLTAPATTTDQSCKIPLKLSAPSREPVVVYYRTEKGSAVPGEDYVSVEQGYVVIPPGTVEAYVPIVILSDADDKEPPEQFSVLLIGASGAYLGDERRCVVTILQAPPQ